MTGRDEVSKVTQRQATERVRAWLDLVRDDDPRDDVIIKTARNGVECVLTKSDLRAALAQHPDEPSPAASRYPWHEAPDWAMWAATDGDGEALWYELPPQACDGEEGYDIKDGYWDDFSGGHDDALIRVGDGFCPHWRDTLERRPTDPRTEQRG
jgi:hypothetical protein